MNSVESISRSFEFFPSVIISLMLDNGMALVDIKSLQMRNI